MAMPMAQNRVVGGLIDVLIAALIAIFLVYRLMSVLGRRTGHERQRPNPFEPVDRGEAAGAKNEAGATDNVVALPDRVRAGREGAVPGLTELKIADPSFDENAFVQGAQIAFGMIVEAFAKGDVETLRPLLSQPLMDGFENAIGAREAAGEHRETRVEKILAVDLLEARLDDATALITVKFVSSQVDVTRDSQGTVTEGDPDAPTEVTDIWTFARDTRARDPNWILVETRSPN